MIQTDSNLELTTTDGAKVNQPYNIETKFIKGKILRKTYIKNPTFWPFVQNDQSDCLLRSDLKQTVNHTVIQ